VLVTRWRKTPEAAVRAALRLLPRGQVRLAGVTLNRVKARRQAEFMAPKPTGLLARLEARRG
jgi:Mrp family chromosome partitioning ATPase